MCNFNVNQTNTAVFEINYIFLLFKVLLKGKIDIIKMFELLSPEKVPKKCETVDEFFDNSLFRYIKIYLKVLGMWPYQDIKKRRLIYIIIWFGVFSAAIPEVLLSYINLKFNGNPIY